MDVVKSAVWSSFLAGKKLFMHLQRNHWFFPTQKLLPKDLYSFCMFTKFPRYQDCMSNIRQWVEILILHAEKGIFLCKWFFQVQHLFTYQCISVSFSRQRRPNLQADPLCLATVHNNFLQGLMQKEDKSTSIPSFMAFFAIFRAKVPSKLHN